MLLFQAGRKLDGVDRSQFIWDFFSNKHALEQLDMSY